MPLPLAFMVLDEKFAFFHIAFPPVSNKSFLSEWSQDFFLILILKTLIMICLNMDPFGSTCLRLTQLPESVALCISPNFGSFQSWFFKILIQSPFSFFLRLPKYECYLIFIVSQIHVALFFFLNPFSLCLDQAFLLIFQVH